jgi:ppGpp synthetase/RelA/SpoT-type nucleotidyltranferase
VTELELKAAFERQKPILSTWGKLVRDTILARLQSILGGEKQLGDFLKIPSEPRVKDTDSFLAKALRRRKNYARPLEEITDMVGVRFVVLLLTDLKIIEQVIENCELWEAEKARDFEAEKAERPHYFDYQSVHYIVHPKAPINTGQVTVPIQTNCEVQVRTLLQHAYAELAHNTTYKASLILDRDVNRQIAKSSALVEATDELFIRVDGKVREASAELARLHKLLVNVYQKRFGMPGTTDERVTSTLLDPYRGSLTILTEQRLDEFLDAKDFIIDRVKERSPLSIFYRHPVVLAVYFLVANDPDIVPKQWPSDQKHLEMIYTDLGLSTEGRLW